MCVAKLLNLLFIKYMFVSAVSTHFLYCFFCCQFDLTIRSCSASYRGSWVCLWFLWCRSLWNVHVKPLIPSAKIWVQEFSSPPGKYLVSYTPFVLTCLLIDNQTMFITNLRSHMFSYSQVHWHRAPSATFIAASTDGLKPRKQLIQGNTYILT